VAEMGELTGARELCEKLLSYASPLQLYAEEIDPRSGRHLGNFPQAFSHLALINAVMHVIRAEAGASQRLRGLGGSPPALTANAPAAASRSVWRCRGAARGSPCAPSRCLSLWRHPARSSRSRRP